MNSMTGYAYNEAEIDGARISVEVKGVNGRFLDLNISAPYFLGTLESRIRREVSQRVARGKCDVIIRVNDKNAKSVVSANLSAAASYCEALKKIALSLGRDEGEVSLGLIAAQEGVLDFSREYDAEAYWEKIKGLFEMTLDEFVAARAGEGEALKRDMLEKLDTLDRCAAFFKEWQPKMEEKFRESVTAKFKEILGDAQIDENRVMAEVASMLVRYTINEEIVRLQSHLASLREEFENALSGKRIDFICQEAGREINTIGSKNQFVEVGREVVNAKDALENIREQAKNVE